jgi:hypothetical protein
MPLLNLVVASIVVGMGLGLINRYIPIFVLKSVGLWGEVSTFRVGR